MKLCTIIAKNYVAQARVLARSFAEHHPDGEVSVLVIDDFDGYLDPQEEPFRLLSPSDIGCAEFELMAARYDILELSTAVKPWLLQTLLDRGLGAVVYLDPDIAVYASLEPVVELAQDLPGAPVGAESLLGLPLRPGLRVRRVRGGGLAHVVVRSQKPGPTAWS